ncbi:hypothetical protein JXB22_07375 [candidate division WOR-3 bacterium]|nr:hypothetical protein [candidate division WOR-3 bacterium]
MKLFYVVSAMICCIGMRCTDDPGEPFYTDMFGWIQKSTDSTGVNGLNLRIYDLDPNDLENTRMRERTTAEHDSVDGYFEIDSIIYSTTNMQGVGYVTIVVDSTTNPNWPSQLWQPSLRGGVDSIVLYIHGD